MNVAVGGTNGWFPDGTEKPWLDGSASKNIPAFRLWRLIDVSLAAMSDFWKLKDTWYPTWPQNAEDRSLVVYVDSIFPLEAISNLSILSDSVKMWEQC